MEYIANGYYKVNLNGTEVEVSAEDLREAFLDIKKYENEEVNSFVESVSPSYIYEDSAKYELLITEIKDDGYKNIKWSDELDTILETAVDAAMATAHNWYTSLYHMERKI